MTENKFPGKDITEDDLKTKGKLVHQIPKMTI